jgi:hypothetical protein
VPSLFCALDLFRGQLVELGEHLQVWGMEIDPRLIVF